MWLLRYYGYDDAKSYYNNVKECMEEGSDGERGKFDCTSIARFQSLSVTDPYIHISTQFTAEIDIFTICM